jgi:hypothetical protein
MTIVMRLVEMFMMFVTKFATKFVSAFWLIFEVRCESFGHLGLIFKKSRDDEYEVTNLENCQPFRNNELLKSPCAIKASNLLKWVP